MGRSRGGLTTKIHALVDGRGLPIGLHLSEGQASDCREAEGLIDAVPSGATFLGDKAYDSDAIRIRITEQGSFANIPAKRKRRKSFGFSSFLYCARNMGGRFFGKLKNARGLATRYDKRRDNFLAAIKLLCTRLWIAANESTANDMCAPFRMVDRADDAHGNRFIGPRGVFGWSGPAEEAE